MDVRFAGALAGFVCTVGCGGPREASDTVVVFAAASLMEAFEELEETYEDQHPGRDVRLSFAGSHVLRMQIEHGATVDLVATADLRHLEALQTQALVVEPKAFAVNRLAVVVAEEGLDHIQELEDLPAVERVVLGGPQVPVGQYARQMLESCDGRLARNVLDRVVSLEDSARLVRAKVELGEAQAAVIYQSDLQAGRALREIPIPERCQVNPVYGISRVSGSSNEATGDFLRLLESEVGEGILQSHGFEGLR